MLTSFVTVPVGAPATRARLGSIDLLRGLVMIVMVLDHTRDYVHTGGLVADPTNLATTTPMLFLTRWVTHYCAPIFVFLAGVGAYLQLSRGMTTRDLSRFLVTRGLWLVVLEFTVIRVTTWFNVDYSLLANFQVIWTLGVSMIVLAALIHLPLGAIAAFGMAMVVGHNAFDGIRVASWQGPGSPVPSAWDKLWILLHQGAEFVPVFGGSGPVVFVIYPLVPWVGVIALGYVCGSLYTLDPGRRRVLLRRIGLALIAAFIVIRATNIYGDPRPWAPQGTMLFSVFSFVNTTKYPVSLLYLLMTIGPALLALAWFESRREAVGCRAGRHACRPGAVVFLSVAVAARARARRSAQRRRRQGDRLLLPESACGVRGRAAQRRLRAADRLSLLGRRAGRSDPDVSVVRARQGEQSGLVAEVSVNHAHLDVASVAPRSAGARRAVA